jgi:homoaconitase/3-isopropylmalate dehydratase large subunit
MRWTLILFAVLGLQFTTAVHAEVLSMPQAEETTEVELDASQLGPSVATPRKGSSMKEVVARFGQPLKKYRAVGGSSKQQPPITRWDYEQFYVFFEYSHVVRAVVPGLPPKLQRQDGLRPVAGG